MRKMTLVSIPNAEIGERVRRTIRYSGLSERRLGMAVGLSSTQLTQRILPRYDSRFRYPELVAIARECAGKDLLRNATQDDLLEYFTGQAAEIPGLSFELASWKVEAA